MTCPRHLPNCAIPAKAGTQADGSVVEDDIGKARVSADGIEGPTNVVFTDASAPAQLGMYTLEGALLVVDPVRQRLVPTHELRIIALRDARNCEPEKSVYVI